MFTTGQIGASTGFPEGALELTSAGLLAARERKTGSHEQKNGRK
jgi:hypothetical protein